MKIIVMICKHFLLGSNVLNALLFVADCESLATITPREVMILTH